MFGRCLVGCLGQGLGRCLFGCLGQGFGRVWQGSGEGTSGSALPRPPPRSASSHHALLPLTPKGRTGSRQSSPIGLGFPTPTSLSRPTPRTHIRQPLKGAQAHAKVRPSGSAFPHPSTSPPRFHTAHPSTPNGRTGSRQSSPIGLGFPAPTSTAHTPPPRTTSAPSLWPQK